MKTNSDRLMIILGSTSAIWQELKALQLFSNIALVNYTEGINQNQDIIDTDGITTLTYVLDFRSPAPNLCTSDTVGTDLQRMTTQSLHLLDRLPSNTIYIRMSSGSVYGAKSDEFYPTEFYPFNPMSYYSELHAAVDQQLIKYIKGCFIIRLPNVILSAPKAHHFQSRIISLRNNDKLILSDDGTTVRNFIPVATLAAVICKIMDNTNSHSVVQTPEPNIINISEGEVLTTIEYIKMLCTILSIKPKVIPVNKSPKERFRVLASTSKYSTQEMRK